MHLLRPSLPSLWLISFGANYQQIPGKRGGLAGFYRIRQQTLPLCICIRQSSLASQVDDPNPTKARLYLL